jgi:hypothetical protein
VGFFAEWWSGPTGRDRTLNSYLQPQVGTATTVNHEIFVALKVGECLFFLIRADLSSEFGYKNLENVYKFKCSRYLSS